MIRALKSKLTVPEMCIIGLYAVIAIAFNAFFEFKVFALAALVVVMALLSLLVFDNKKTTLENTGLSLLCMLYPSTVLITMIKANALGEYSLLALLLIFIVSPCADVFAYIVGITFKGKKLCPEISPKKTISGAVGGLIGGIGGSIAIYYIVGQKIETAVPAILVFALFGLVCSLLTEFGDLVESVIKRKTGIKDMGNIFPGHGGILDRIDGILFASVFIFYAFDIIIALL